MVGEHVEGGWGRGGERPGFDVLGGLEEKGVVAEGGEELEGWCGVGGWGGRHVGWWVGVLGVCLLES